MARIRNKVVSGSPHKVEVDIAVALYHGDTLTSQVTILARAASYLLRRRCKEFSASHALLLATLTPNAQGQLAALKHLATLSQSHEKLHPLVLGNTRGVRG